MNEIKQNKKLILFLNKIKQTQNIHLLTKLFKTYKKNQINYIIKKWDPNFELQNQFSKKFYKVHLKKNKNFINYILSFTLSKKNAHITLTDIKGNVKKKFTAGFFNIKKKRKRINICLKTLYMLLRTNKKLLKKKILAIHFNNFYSTPLRSFILKVFKRKKTPIKCISAKYLRIAPRNGCRPKKIKRKKHRKIIFK